MQFSALQCGSSIFISGDIEFGKWFYVQVLDPVDSFGVVIQCQVAVTADCHIVHCSKMSLNQKVSLENNVYGSIIFLKILDDCEALPYLPTGVLSFIFLLYKN